ncbi:MAG: hypothetical protein OK439_06090 [Thaumarchaeota archaeon]|nr:hypothetical protein [Nitrososphaerota archaeon]
MAELRRDLFQVNLNMIILGNYDSNSDQKTNLEKRDTLQKQIEGLESELSLSNQ